MVAVVVAVAFMRLGHYLTRKGITMQNNTEHWKKYKQDILSKLNFDDVFSQINNQKPGSNGWVSGLCPFHADTRSSFSYNHQTGQWKCFTGCGGGSVLDYIVLTSGQKFKDVLFMMGDKLGIQRPYEDQAKRPPIKEELIRHYQDCLNNDEGVKKYLQEQRGLALATINRYQVGWDIRRQRFTIPVRDERGILSNIRLYNAKKDPKIINYTEGVWKYGSPARLYGLDELVKSEGKQVILCEGEWDRLLLQQENLLAVSGTHGCSVFRPEWVQFFRGRNIIIIYDNDKEGQNAAVNIVLKAFKNSEINSVKNIALPLKGDKDDKDITDFFHRHGFTGADLQKLIDETPVHKYGEEKEAEEIIRLDSFTEIERKEIIDRKVQCEITVCGETSEAFHATEVFKVNFCPKLKKGECFDCAEPINIPCGSQEYIGSCMSNNIQLIAMLRSFCCRYVQKPNIEILKRTTIKEFFCHQRVNRITQTRDDQGNIIQYIDGKKQELLEKRVYFLSSEHVKPGNYLATGYVKTHPKTQQVTLLIETLVPQDDDYQSFDLQKNLVHLQAFQKLSWTDILDDLTENVTKVYERNEILIAILLTYCSPLWIRFNEEIIRGWLLTTIIGDSGSGKSQTHTRLAEFVNIGDCFSGLTGSRTGLAYALVEHPLRGWQVRIGRYPANSRKILTVDETQHLPDWDLRAISKAMDEGFMLIDKVISGGYESMTRLILICNPKKDQVMDGFSWGCQTLREVYPPTIIRRIDLAVFANSGDIQDISFVNRKKSGHSPRKITPEMLRAVIYWVWNLKPAQVVFESDAEDFCLSKATELSEKYGYAVDVPLVPPSDFRNILARISAAFAAFLLSSDEEFSKLIIKQEHVDKAVRLLNEIYSHDNCGLDDYSDIQKMGSQLMDYEDIERIFLDRKEREKDHYQNENIFVRAIHTLRINDSIKREDLAEQVGCGMESIRLVIKLLKRFNLIDSQKNGYVKKPKFNKFLRRFLKTYPDFLKWKEPVEE